VVLVLVVVLMRQHDFRLITNHHAKISFSHFFFIYVLNSMLFHFQTGNNVYQTGIKLSDSEKLDSFCAVLLKEDIILHMARNQFGLCVIRCLFLHVIGTPESFLSLKKRLLLHWNELCYLKYGNLTAQFLLTSSMNDQDFEQFDLFNIVRTMSKHPHGNHVVQSLCQRCALEGTEEQKSQIIQVKSKQAKCSTVYHILDVFCGGLELTNDSCIVYFFLLGHHTIFGANGNEPVRCLCL
jgi:hypothetical protein